MSPIDSSCTDYLIEVFTVMASVANTVHKPLDACIRGRPLAVVFFIKPKYRCVKVKSYRFSYSVCFSDVFAL